METRGSQRIAAMEIENLASFSRMLLDNHRRSGGRVDVGRDRYKALERDLDGALLAACKESPRRGLEVLRQAESKYKKRASRDINITDRLLKSRWVISALAKDYSQALECIHARLNHYNAKMMSDYDLCMMILDMIHNVDHIYENDSDKLGHLRAWIHNEIYYEHISFEPAMALVVRSLTKFENAGKSVVFKNIYRRACVFYSLDPGGDLNSNISKMQRKHRGIAKTR